MLIGIDASRAVKTQKTGTEHYCQEIIKALARIDRRNNYLLYSPIKPEKDFADQLGRNFRWKIMPFHKLWSQVRLSWELMTARTKPDVIFEPAHTIPVVHTGNMVVTIHDLGFRYFPELYTPFERAYHSFSARFSATRAAHVIAVSQYTKKDILRHYSVAAEKVSVVHHGYDRSVFKPATSEVLPENVGMKRPYIFFIGRLERKKNLARMLETYALLKKKRGFNHQLVLGGKPGYGYDEAIAKKIDGVVETGYVDENQKALLMKNADLFFFPSLFEGFGMPIIEAMACGVPVVASNTTSLPEIVGDAGLLVPPRDSRHMAAAIGRLIESPALRRQLVAKGLKRVQQFSWNKAGRETLAILEKVGNAKRRA